MIKCSICGGRNVSKITPPNANDKFFIPTVNTSTNSIDITSGLAVDIYGCVECKGLSFKDEKITSL